MTLVFGQQEQSDCDVCCVCGLFCSNTPYCGRNMEFVLTHSGASNGASCVNCSDLDGTSILMSWDGVNTRTFSASVWNSTWKSDYPAQAFDAKDGTNVCIWWEGPPKTDLDASCYSGAYYSASGIGGGGPVIAVYFGTDDKWHMTYKALYYEDNGASGYSSVMSGDAEFAGGGAAMDCGTVGEMTPTFSLTITLSEYNAAGGPQDCVPPTSVLVEGNPQ